MKAATAVASLLLLRSASAFAPTITRTSPPTTGNSIQLSKSKLELKSADKTITDVENNNPHPTSASTTICSTASLSTTSTFQIHKATYSDLAQAADLMTDGFYPKLRNNPILRPIRYLMELDRLQNNFPYDDDGRHFYLVAYDSTPIDGKGNNLLRKVVGFCDVDGRIPKPKSARTDANPFSMFLKRIVRPQPYFSDLAVHPDHRRQGIASVLMSEAEGIALTMGFDELYLGVDCGNELALGMYSRTGYEFIIPQGDLLAFLEIQPDMRMLRRSL